MASTPGLAAHAVITDDAGRVLLIQRVDPAGGEAAWDLPGGMLGDEGPVDGLLRCLREESGLRDVEVGRLLAVDTVPASVHGRTVVDHVHAGYVQAVHIQAAHPVDPGATAGYFAPEKAAELVPGRLARRLLAALAAQRGAHTAVLEDGVPRPLGQGDYYATLPAPMMAATVVVTRTDGRVLILQPSYKQHAELPGGMVEAHESPADGAARELWEELGLEWEVGRVLAVDTSSARQSKHGRALSTFVFALKPLTPEQSEAMVLGDEVSSVRWLTREQAREALPWRLAARMDAALDARASGATVHLSRGRPDLPAPTGPEADQGRA
ncbi:NUDIX domain-containing protein [Streptacidiphilus sp. MAP5-3]|uniref:NUDIX hydrolase n=1 Tax=unclassified Streptacidiphilus TaxID=2643834 RepID=UPI00351879F5